MEIFGIIISLVIGIAMGAGALYFMMSKLLQSEKNERADDRTQFEKRIDVLETEKKSAIEQAKQEADKIIVKAKEEEERRRKEELVDLKKSYQEQIETLKSNLQSTTENLLKQRSTDLQQENNKQVNNLLAPLQENIKAMKQAIESNNELSVRNNQSFSEQMRHMMESSQSLSSQAERLSNALQRDNKIVGNWGELILSELLESQGLENGKHFDLQSTLKDDTGNAIKNEDSGKKMIPDAVLHFADDRDVVIDSKMSLTAFIDYQNAQTDEERKDALDRHLKSVRSHVKELKDKDYSNYFRGKRKSCGFVMMFIPIEGALQLAVSEDKDLWRSAFDQKVFIVGAQTLMAALRIIDLTWVNVQQQRNINEILSTAKQLIDKVCRFQTSFVDVKKKLDSLSDSYEKVVSSVEGKQGILSSGRKLEKLGVKGNKTLPSSNADDDDVIESVPEE